LKNTGAVGPFARQPAGFDPWRGQGKPGWSIGDLRPVVAADAAFLGDWLRLRDAVETCYTRARKIFCMFSKASTPIRRGQFSLIRAREFAQYKLSLSENWTGHA